MTAAPTAERRRHDRYPLSTSLSFHHGPSRRDYPGRSRNVSRSGLCMLVPPTVPVQLGHRVRVGMGPLPGLQRTCRAEPVAGTIVRVDRSDLAREGAVAVAVRFDAA